MATSAALHKKKRSTRHLQYGDKKRARNKGRLNHRSSAFWGGVTRTYQVYLACPFFGGSRVSGSEVPYFTYIFCLRMAALVHNIVRNLSQTCLGREAASITMVHSCGTSRCTVYSLCIMVLYSQALPFDACQQGRFYTKNSKIENTTKKQPELNAGRTKFTGTQEIPTNISRK